MTNTSFETNRTSEGATVLTFHVPLDYINARLIWEELSGFLRSGKPTNLELDLHDSGSLDSSGIAILRLLQRRCRETGAELHLRSIPPGSEYFLQFIESQPPPPKHKFKVPGPKELVVSTGNTALSAVAEILELIAFFGDFLLSASRNLYRFRKFRWKETAYYTQATGADAMPVIFLLSFLIGLVMAFQAAVQLRQFGANIYVADLVSLALIRELGPVFTALTLAGRSGSAFAAEIGTMKVNEEIDALTVMGFDITQFLVLPKVFALAFCGPLLTLWADASGIFGGMVVGVLTLDVPMTAFLHEVGTIIGMSDIATGMIKSFTFSLLTALIGCFRGLQVEEGADGVGRQTTSAVVSATLLIILSDAVFTVLFHVLKW